MVSVVGTTGEQEGWGVETVELEQLRRSGTASVRFSNAVSHFTTVFTLVERTDADAAPRPAMAAAGGVPTGRAAEILGLFGQRPELSAGDISRETGLGSAMVRRYLRQLLAEGKLQATAPPASPNRAYRLPG